MKKMTSAEWQSLKPDMIVIDPDGWDRKNYQFSWYEELITEEEYDRRLIESTCIGYIDKNIKNEYSEISSTKC